MNLKFVKSSQHFSLEAVGTSQGICKHNLDFSSNSQMLCKKLPIILKFVVLKSSCHFVCSIQKHYMIFFVNGD